MEYQKQFTRLNETPAVEPKLQDRIAEVHRSLRRVDVVRMVGGNKTRKVNGLKFTLTPSGHPDEDSVEIAEAIVACAEYDCDQKGSVAKYRAILFVDEGGEERKVRVQFKPELDYDDDDDESPSGNSVQDNAFSMAKEAMSLGRNEILALCGIQNNHILELQDRLLEHSKTGTKTVETLQQMLSEAYKRCDDAYAAKDRALQVIYSAKSAEVEANAKAKKDEMLAQLLKAALPILATTVGIAAKKYGMPAPEVPFDDEEDEDEDDDDNEVTVDETSEEYQQQQEVADIEKRLQEAPVLTMMSRLKETIEADQVAAIAQALTKKNFKLTMSAMEQKTEADAVMEVQRLGLAVMTKPDILEKFTSILSEDQVTVITQAYQIAVATAANHVERDGGDN